MRRPRRRSRRRGVALILVLSAISILTVMLTEFQEETSAELGSAISERDALKAEYAARSAVNLARLLIAAEPTVRKSLALLGAVMGGALPQLPVWELATDLLGAFNDEAGRASFSQLASVDLAEAKNLELDGAAFELVVVDEDSKVNVNLPARGTVMAEKQTAEDVMGLMRSPEYDPMFESRDDDGNFNQRTTVCSAIVDWADPNQDTYPCDANGEVASTSVAAEDAYYERQKVPYSRKNAAFDSLEELRLVRGVTEEFWSTFVEPDPEDPRKRNVTVWGSGKVNINTANPFTLASLICANAVDPLAEPFCTDPEQRLKFLMVMNMVDGMTAGVPIFTSPKAFLRVVQGKGGGMGKMLFDALGIAPIGQLLSEKVLEDKVTAESKVFSIYATGIASSGKNEARVRIHAVVDFRAAPPPGQNRSMADLSEAAGLGPSSLGDIGGTSGGSASGATGTGSLDADALNEALMKDPGGTIIYYRVD